MTAHGIAGEILHLSVLTPTVEAAARALGVQPAQIVKSILFLVEAPGGAGIKRVDPVGAGSEPAPTAGASTGANPVPAPTGDSASGVDAVRPYGSGSVGAHGVRPSIFPSVLGRISSTDPMLPVLAITCGTAYVERRAIAARYGVGRKRVKLASPEEVVAVSGYEVGAMPPFGHRPPLPTLLDRRVLDLPVVYAGGGDENALLRLDAQDIARFTGAVVMDLIALPDQEKE